MRRAQLEVLAVAAAAWLLGSSGCDRVIHGCTLIGCQDGASFSLQRQDGSKPELAVSLDLDGRTVDCAAPQGTGEVACDNVVRISSRELTSCTEQMQGNARVLTCTPTGTFEEVITIASTPANIGVV